MLHLVVSASLEYREKAGERLIGRAAVRVGQGMTHAGLGCEVVPFAAYALRTTSTAVRIGHVALYECKSVKVLELLQPSSARHHNMGSGYRSLTISSPRARRLRAA